MSETKIDPITNMPVVPDGYSWKVKVRWKEFSPNPTVLLKLKKGLTTVAYTETQLAELDERDVEAGRDGHRRHYDLVRIDVDDYPLAIQYLAEGVLEKNKKQLEEASFYKSFESAKKRLSGKYPPKKLDI